MRELLSSTDANMHKKQSIYFVIAQHLNLVLYLWHLKGCDALVFTAGIGENAAIIRKKICERLDWLGIKIDDKANKNNATIISEKDSNIIVSVIPTNEEYMIAKHTKTLCII